jgi:hypothetical protein
MAGVVTLGACAGPKPLPPPSQPPTQAPPAPIGTWSSISYSKANKTWAVATGASTKAAALAQSQARCGRPDCEVAIAAERQYVMLASGDDGTFESLAWDTELEIPLTLTVGMCNKRAKGCRWRVWAYSDGKKALSGENDGTYLFPISLEDVGGEFHHVIKDFEGVRQKQSEWCWIATVAGQVERATGAHLDQEAVAQLDVAKSTFDPATGARLTFRPDDCRGAKGATGACNQDGPAPNLLALFGLNVPEERLPPPPPDESAGNVRAAMLKEIRTSLAHDFPVAARFVWLDLDAPHFTDAHYMTIYGAEFTRHAGGAKSNTSITLHVYDPDDGSRVELDGSIYAMGEKGTKAGLWAGQVAIIDPERAKDAKVHPSTCPLLTAEDQARVCPKQPPAVVPACKAGGKCGAARDR